MPALSDSLLSSRAWRLSNLYTIVDDQARLVPFTPNLAQRDFYNHLWFCNHVLKARKLGFSTFIEILNLDDLLFNRNFTAGIVDKTIDDAKKKLKMQIIAWENLDNGDIHPDTWRIGRQIKKANKIVTKAKEELAWENGSTSYCGVSLRGGTVNRLHISELGSVSVKAPQKAEEIVAGAMNAFTPGNRCDIETTHEGGRIGTNYRLMRVAMKADPQALTQKDFRFHFFAWWRDPRYVLPLTRPIRPEIVEYFTRLEAELGRTFTAEQKMFYDSTQLIQGHGMKKEFPSTPGEAFEAIAEGAIYGTEMANLRAGNRITDFGMERNLPIFTFWDIGLSDYLSIWLIQPVGRAFLVLDWAEFEGVPGSAMPDHMLLWERKWGKPIARHYLPHDANTRDRGSGKSYATTLQEGGLQNLAIVPRTPDTWLGIGYVRDILPHCWFHKTHCDTPREHHGQEKPSGVACLEGYTKAPPGTGGQLREMPLHNEFSHSSDAFRTFAEAWRLGMVDASATPTKKPRAVRGTR